MRPILLFFLTFYAAELPALPDSALLRRFERHSIVKGNDTLPYRLLRPIHFQLGKIYPVVLFLHGAGERGRDNERSLTHLPGALTDSAGQRDFECFILVPQCPRGRRWVDVHWSDSAHRMPPLSVVGGLVLAALDAVLAQPGTDSTRVYVTGLSMGGFGAWDFACRFPGKFACAVPVCGGGDENQAGSLRMVPVWAFHGARDEVVRPERSIRMTKAVNAAGGNARLTLLHGVPHNCWTQVYKDPELFRWMFSQRKS
jgi:predicted peptidase